MPTLWKKNIYSYTNERMERRYVYRRYFGLMLLFGFPQETQLDKISPTVLVILIISMASLSRDAFLCLCHPSQKLFFRRKHLHGTILFRNFLQIYYFFLIYANIYSFFL